MKKKFLLLLALTVCILAVFLSACQKTPDVMKNTSYVLDVKCDGETISCSQTTVYTNTVADALENVTFAVYPLAYTADAEKKAYVGELPRYASVNISALSVDGKEAESTFSGMYMTIPVALSRGEKTEIKMEYSVVLPECDLRLGYKNGYANLSNFYPQVCVYENGAFRTDDFSAVGDPIYSDVADFTVTFDLPENVTAALPFSAVETDKEAEEGRKILSVAAENVRDFAVVIKEGYKEYLADADGVKVRYYSVREDAQENCDLAADAIKTFSSAFGRYPYGDYVLAETVYDADGMEYSGMAFISSDATDKNRAILHETAHQWFYNVVGNDNVNSPYLDEGLATFLTEYYALLKGNQESFDAGMETIKLSYARYERLQNMRGEKGELNMTLPIYQYSEYRYGMLVYNKSALLFDSLYRLGGKDKFNASLSHYVNENYFARADKTALVAAFSKGMKSDVTGLVDGFLTEGAVVATFAGE